MNTAICTSCKNPVHARAAATFRMSQCVCQGVRKLADVRLELPVVIGPHSQLAFMAASHAACRRPDAASV